MSATWSSMHNEMPNYSERLPSDEEINGVRDFPSNVTVREQYEHPVMLVGDPTTNVSILHALAESSRSIACSVTGSGLHGGSTGLLGTLLPNPSLNMIDRLGEQFGRLAQLAELPAEWDGSDAIPPIPDTVLRAANLMIFVAVNTLHAPVLVAPLTDGSLQIEWSDGMKRLELVIDVDGSLSADLITGIGTDHRQFRELGDVDESTVHDIVNLFAD